MRSPSELALLRLTIGARASANDGNRLEKRVGAGSASTNDQSSWRNDVDGEETAEAQ